MTEALLEAEDVIEAEANLDGQIGTKVECNVTIFTDLAM